jgi:hypothetical protein
MSCANIGISQLEALQLSNLVGPTGIGRVQYQNDGLIETLAITNNKAVYNPRLTVPSGTGIVKIRFDTTLTASNNLTPAMTQLEFQINNAVQFTARGFSSGNVYEGMFMYQNQNPTPANIIVKITTVNTSSIDTDIIFADVISFGPYVRVGQ